MVVLKSKLSGLYFKAFGVWISDPLDAAAFPTEWSARQFARSEHVDDVQVIEPDTFPTRLSAAA